MIGGVPDPDSLDKDGKATRWIISKDGLAEIGRYVRSLHAWIKVAAVCLVPIPGTVEA